MQLFPNQAVSLYTTNKTIPTVDKPKVMVNSFHKQPADIPLITPERVKSERVKNVMLFGIIVACEITRNENTIHISSKVSKHYPI